MGIKGIYQEIGPGQRLAISKLAVETFEQKGRPLRLAIDISIWLFQIQSGKGGTNPALRTFYYRLLRLISLCIHPVFVFDGPNKPPFKRNKKTGPNVASIPEFLAKQLLKHFRLPFHLAPGEAEAECALLQRRGIVDAVLSEDVDTLMFGSGLTLRNWSAEGKAKVPTHVNLYDAQKTKEGPAGLDRQGMILVALMSGGDYIPEGVPGCGPKTACEAARAGFGKDLCRLSKHDTDSIAQWKERLCHELSTNENKFFKRKHKGLTIPEDFPRMDILHYYTNPCLSSDDAIERLRHSLKWDEQLDIGALRTFTADAFDWTYLGGAKKFIRNLAPALLVQSLRMRASTEDALVKHIHSTRNHHSTDGTTEVRLSFLPHNLVDIDLDAEEPDPEEAPANLDQEDDEVLVVEEDDDEGRRTRKPSTYDPTIPDRVWILETFVKTGAPRKMEEWEASTRKAKTLQAEKAARKKRNANGGMPHGALDRFTTLSKPGIQVLQDLPSTAPTTSAFSKGQDTPKRTQPSVVDLLSSPEKASPPRKRQFQRSHSDTAALRKPRSGAKVATTLVDPLPDEALEKSIPQGQGEHIQTPRKGRTRAFVPPPPLESPAQTPRKKTTPGKTKNDAIVILSSPRTPSSAQKQITDFMSPSRRAAASPTPRSKRTEFATALRPPLVEAAGNVECRDARNQCDSFSKSLKDSQSVGRIVRLCGSAGGLWACKGDDTKEGNWKRGKEWRLSGVQVMDLTET